MNTQTLGRLALVLLLAAVSAPTLRPQEKKESKPSDKLVLHKEQSGNQETSKEAREPQDGEEWYNRGYELHSADRYPEAIKAFKRAAELGHRKGAALYNIACGYSLLNDKENALVWLKRALDSGFDSPEHLADDSDLDPLRSDPRFKTILTNVTSFDDRHGRRSVKVDRLAQADHELERLEREGSKDGNRWSEVGVQLLRLRELDRATVALQRAVGYLGYRGSTAMYNLACAYSLKGERDTGIEWLQKSVDAGFDSPEKFRYDPDIASLRFDARFPRIEQLSNTLSLSQFYGDKDTSDDYSNERWAPAIELYESFLKTEPNSGRGWFNLGYALHYSRQHVKAISAFEHALSLGYQKPTSTYNIACAYSMLDQRDSAFAWLDRALAAGFDSFGNLGWDKDLDNLRSDPRFKRFRDTADYNSNLRTRR